MFLFLLKNPEIYLILMAENKDLKVNVTDKKKYNDGI